MAKVKVKNPVVEGGGDEMTRIIRADIENRLILPFLEVDLKDSDLPVQHLELPAQAQGDQPRPV